MSVAYLLGGTIVGALAALVWLIVGGSVAGAMGMYMLAGQTTFVAMAAHVALTDTVRTG